jgi:hypothetical protein
VPPPADLTGNNANKHAEVWRGQVGVSTATSGAAKGNRQRVKQKTFFIYIEIFEQTAHDAGLHAFARQRGIQPRRAHRGQVQPANNNRDNPLEYYAPHGQMAADMVADYITARWNATVTTNDNIFVQTAKHTLASQAQVQPNGFCYEVTMWYADNEVYVAFHCYHA